MEKIIEIKQVNLQKDNPEVVEFLRKNVQPRMDRKIYDWEYFFEDGGAVFITASAGEQVVATQSFLPYNLMVNGKRENTSKSENSFLSSDFRGGTTFKDVYSYGLDKCWEAGHQFVWGFTPVGKVWEKKLEFKVWYDPVIDFRTVIRPLNLSNNLKGVRSMVRCFYYNFKWLTYSFKRYAWWKAISYKKTIGELEIENAPRDYNRVKELYDKVVGKNVVALDMDEAFFDWRVRQNPVLDYQTKFFYRDGNLAGYYIYSVDKLKKNDTAQLAEIIASDDQILQVMAAHMIKDVSRSGAIYMEYFSNKYNLHCTRLLELLTDKVGGRSIPNPMSFVVKSSSREIPAIDHWYFNALWTEGFDR